MVKEGETVIMSLCLAKGCVNRSDIALNAKLALIFASNNVFNWVWQITWWACTISFLFYEMYIFQRQSNNLSYRFVNAFDMRPKYHAFANTAANIFDNDKTSFHNMGKNKTNQNIFVWLKFILPLKSFQLK